MKFSTSKLTKMAFIAGLAVASAIPAFAQDKNEALPIAIQMYTLRDAGTVDEQFSILNRAGVSNIETVDMQKLGADELKGLLEKHKLTVISSHVPLPRLREELDKVITEQKAVGNTVITVPNLRPEVRPTDAKSWEALGKELGGYAEKLAGQGLKIAYHNHDYEMVEFDGKTALEILLAAAGPNVKSELDIAWVARAGQDPAKFIERLDGRLFAIHVKDNAPKDTAPEEKGFAIVGTGVLDFDTILPAAQKAGAEWYILEHDMPLNAEEVATKGNAYLKEKLPDVLKTAK